MSYNRLQAERCVKQNGQCARLCGMEIGIVVDYSVLERHIKVRILIFHFFLGLTQKRTKDKPCAVRTGPEEKKPCPERRKEKAAVVCWGVRQGGAKQSQPSPGL